MQAKVKFRIGDTVYHKTLNLGAGKVRFLYRVEALVAFEKAVPTRYPKEELCKSESHPASAPDVRQLPAAA